MDECQTIAAPPVIKEGELVRNRYFKPVTRRIVEHRTRFRHTHSIARAILELTCGNSLSTEDDSPTSISLDLERLYDPGVELGAIAGHHPAVRPGSVAAPYGSMVSPARP